MTAVSSDSHETPKEASVNTSRGFLFCKKIVLMAVAALGLNASQAALPDAYIPVEYIESKGDQYIKNVYKCTPNTRVDLDLRLVANSPSCALFADGWGRSWLLQMNGKFVSYGGGETILNEARIGDLYHAQVEYTTATVSNCVTGTSSTRSGITIGGNSNTIAIFACNNGGYKSKYALYGMQIYESGELRRDLVPCFTYIDDVKTAGLYDLVNGVFYKNAGTGEDFKTGPATVNCLTVVGEPGEYGTVTGTMSGYGVCRLTDGDDVTVTMAGTSVDLEDRTATLKGWVLVRKDADGVAVETRSGDANLTSCSFTHRDGDQNILTWIWDVRFKTVLPEGYHAVEYIQSTGSQYIKNAYGCSTTTRVELDFQLDSTTQAGIFGGSWGNAWLLQINGSFTMWGTGTSVGTGYAGDTYHSVHTATWSVMTNLTKGVSSRGDYAAIANATIGLFAVNGGGYKSKYKMYRMAVYEKGTYVDEQTRLLVPCYTNDNGTVIAGLYDVVGKKFYSNAGTGDDFVIGEETTDVIRVTGESGEVGEPVCGSLVGYGKRSLTPGEEVVCTMPVTAIETADTRAELLGWTLEIWRGDSLASTTTNNAANFDTCAFTHQRGDVAKLIWRWKTKFRVTAVATGGLTVSPAYQWVDGGGSATFTAAGGDVVWTGAGIDLAARRSPTCRVSGVTGPTTVTVNPPNVAYVATNGVDAVGRGTVEAPYATIKYAIANTEAPLDVRVADGTHRMATADCPVLADDIRVIGESRAGTILYGTNQTMGRSFITLNHPAAVVCNVTVSCTISSWQTSGGGDAFQISAGTVSNVLCTAFGTTGSTGIVNLTGDNACFCDSVIDNCKFWNSASCMLSVSDGLVERVRLTRSYNGYSDTAGSGVRLTGANAVVRNCLIDSANLTTIVAKDCPVAYVSNGLLENCTIVNNYVKGSPLTGLYVASKDAAVRNCIIVGNSMANIGVANDDCRGAISNSCCPELIVGENGNVTFDPEFTDAENGDYTLLGTSPCINIGADTDATLDFACNPRKYNGSMPDLGCYEFQGESELTDLSVAFSPTVSTGLNELDTVFNAVVIGVRGASVDYTWDFGDGTSVAETTVPTVAHHYSAPGEYTVILACDDGVGTCVCTNTCIFVNSDNPVRYVNAGNPNPRYPYETPETACRDFDTVWMLSPAPEEIHVAPGQYNVVPAKRVYILNRAVRVIGDDPDMVKFYATESQTGRAIFTLNNTNALLSGVRLEVAGNGYCTGMPSGLDIVCGMASNVLVRGCGSHDAGAVRLRGPNALFVDSRVTHCKVWSASIGALYITEGLADRVTLTNNVEHYSNVQETALRLNGANAICRNSFISGNSSGGGGATSVKPAARVSKGMLENCTVVDNNCGDGLCAGIYVAASDEAVVRNCISIGNLAAGSDETKNFKLEDGASVSHCCSPDLLNGVNGNISADPRFQTVDGFAYAIQTDSPCKNAGEKQAWMNDALDYLHRQRRHGAPDIGCFECELSSFMMILR